MSPGPVVTPPAEVVALFGTYLAGLQDPAAGAAWLALHHPQASILVAGAPARAGAVAPADFAAAHRAAASAHVAGDGFPAGATPVAIGWRADGARGVAAFELADPRRDAPLVVELGVEDVGAGWAIAWAAIADGPPALDYGLGRARALAEYVWREGPLPAAPDRAWLDLAYRRRFLAPEPPLAFAPEARFACDNTGMCCRVAGEVTVTAAGRDFVEALPFEAFAPELAGLRLDERADGRFVIKPGDAGCRFLAGAAGCRIHGLLGTPVFTPCVAFPLRFSETPDGVAVTASRCCPTAQAGFGPLLAEREAEVRARYLQAGPLVRAVPRLSRERTVDWPAYQAAVDDLIGALRIEALPLHRRLWIGSRLLEARLAGGPGDVDEAGLAVLAPLPKLERQVVEAHLGYLLGAIAMLDDALEPGGIPAFGPRRLHDEGRCARWFVDVLFAHDLAKEFGLVTAYALLVVLYAFMVALEQGRGAPLEQRHWIALGYGVDHRILTDGAFKKLFELVPSLADRLDAPDGAQAILRHLHAEARLSAFACG